MGAVRRVSIYYLLTSSQSIEPTTVSPLPLEATTRVSSKGVDVSPFLSN
jgi:hypothetical protein